MLQRPNVIWVFGDQHRAQALGSMGDENVSTPNIDSLAVDGITFENAVSGCPLCCPYRGSLLSGRYPNKAVPGHQIQLPPELLTVAQPFRFDALLLAMQSTPCVFLQYRLDQAPRANSAAALT